jgi:hypothetical protein
VKARSHDMKSEGFKNPFVEKFLNEKRLSFYFDSLFKRMIFPNGMGWFFNCLSSGMGG